VQPEKALQDPALLPESSRQQEASPGQGYVSAAGWLDWLMNLRWKCVLTLPDGTRVLGVMLLQAETTDRSPAQAQR